MAFAICDSMPFPAVEVLLSQYFTRFSNFKLPPHSRQSFKILMSTKWDTKAQLIVIIIVFKSNEIMSIKASVIKILKVISYRLSSTLWWLSISKMCQSEVFF